MRGRLQGRRHGSHVSVYGTRMFAEGDRQSTGPGLIVGRAEGLAAARPAGRVRPIDLRRLDLVAFDAAQTSRLD
jgi:hypothetical protein